MKQFKRSIRFFLFCLIVLIVQPFLQKMDWFSNWTFLKNLDEVLLIISIPFVYEGFRRMRNQKIKRFKAFFFVYIILGIVLSLFNSVPFLAMSIQVLFELKFIVVLFLMVSVGMKANLESKFDQMLKLILVLNIPFVIFQFLNPEGYDEVFVSGGHKGLFILKDSTLIRAAGLFWHQNQLAFFSAIAAAFFVVLKRYAWTNAWVILAVILLLSTLQRQEIVSFILAYLFARYLFVEESFSGKRVLFFLGSFTLITLGVIVFLPLLELLVQQSGLLELSQSIDPRIVFYYNSVIVFLDYFPFGSGFGTFGGFAAANYNQSLYNDLNFGNYTWFNQNIFLTDTYYPHVIAETGFFGVICFVLFCIHLFRYIRFNSAQVKYKMMAVFSLTFLILVSLTSPNINDVFCLFLTFIPLSMVVFSEQNQSGISKR